MMAVALATGGLACGTSAASLCDEYCECEGCSDNELDECIDDIEDNERRADNEGCLDQYDDLLACYDDEGECRDGDDFDLDGCEPEARDLNDCLD
jgi:hypothetical protein